MLKKLVVSTVASLALVAPAAIVVAAPANAHVAPCVSKKELRRVSKGMNIKRVHKIFGTRGKQEYYSSASEHFPAEQWRAYRACTHAWRGGPHGSVNVDFKKLRGVWKVTSKRALW